MIAVMALSTTGTATQATATSDQDIWADRDSDFEAHQPLLCATVSSGATPVVPMMLMFQLRA
jgi:hypothetical protein